MASGDPVVQIIREMPPATLFAPLIARAGGSTPAEATTAWAFDASTVEYMDFLCRLRGYDGGGLTFNLTWMAATATTGNVIWSVAIRRNADDAEDLDTSQTYDYNNSSAVAAPSASGESSYDTVTFTDGADMDSWAEGELAIVRVRRFASDSGDTMTGDAQLLDIEGIET
jgi:hypothetical protein